MNNPDLWLTLFWIAFLLLLSAFFSSSETAITAISKSQLLLMAEKKPYNKGLFEWFLKDIQQALTVILIANNLVNVAASAFATSLAVSLVPRHGVFVAVIVMSVLIIVFGEILPKSVAIAHVNSIFSFCAPIIRALSIILSPATFLVVGFINLFGKLLGIQLSPRHPFITREDIEILVNVGEESGALEEEEKRMIHGIIAFEETRVYEVMIPRTEMVVMPATTTIRKAVDYFVEHGYSRIPIYENSIDDIIGVVYAKDLLKLLLLTDHSVTVRKIARECLFVPESTKIADVFAEMRDKKVHIAIVLDEYGGTAGLVTLEDLIEEIVGEIQDEYDIKETPSIVKEADGTYLIKASLPLSDVNEHLKADFHSDEVDTIGGFVVELLGTFPKVGEKIRYKDWEIEVVEVDRRRIKKLRLTKLSKDTKKLNVEEQ